VEHTAGPLLIVGSGPAGLEAARAYREAGGDGEVIMVSADKHLPYQRPPLSKDYLRGESGDDVLPMEDPGFYAEQGIEVRLATPARSLDRAARTLTLQGGETLPYRCCILATGAAAAPLPVQGADHPGIRLLRSRQDGADLRQAARQARSAVVVGSGFIGCEAAASLARRGLDVTVVTAEQLPQAARLGAAVGERLRGWLIREGVAIRPGAQVARFDGGHRVVLEDGGAIEADLILVAGGVSPLASLAADSGLAVEQDRVAADSGMRTSDPAILTAGDVACAVNAAAGRRLAVEHWGDAVAMGQVAGRTAAGRDAAWSEVPGFWSTIGDKTLKYAAWGDGYEHAWLTERDPEGFTVWYERAGVTVGVLTYQADDDYEQGRTLIAGAQPLRSGNLPDRAVAAGSADTAGLGFG
jgi:3-phenylpropionate/trans-cinnamate dioxygenase ferredoxin reductase component